MKKEFWLIIALAVIIVALIGVLAWPFGKNEKEPQTKVEGIQITSPKEGQEITSPLKITGKVNGGGWTGFEGQVGTVKLLDYKGNELASTYLKATTEWTQPEVSFEATLNFTGANVGPATLVFHNENASGLPEKDKQFALAVKIGKMETTTVKAYFGKNEVTGSTCSVVFPVDRVIAKTDAVAKAAIEELLKGPTQEEKSKGYFSSIPAGSKLNSIKIEKGTAYVDFDQTTQSGGGSCSMSERVSEINFTLKQFPTVKKVVISINGRTDDIFQP